MIFICELSPRKFPCKLPQIIQNNGGSFITEQWCVPQPVVDLISKVEFRYELAYRVNSHGKHKDSCNIIISQCDVKNSLSFKKIIK